MKNDPNLLSSFVHLKYKDWITKPVQEGIWSWLTSLTYSSPVISRTDPNLALLASSFSSAIRLFLYSKRIPSSSLSSSSSSSSMSNFAKFLPSEIKIMVRASFPRNPVPLDFRLHTCFFLNSRLKHAHNVSFGDFFFLWLFGYNSFLAENIIPLTVNVGIL